MRANLFAMMEKVCFPNAYEYCKYKERLIFFYTCFCLSLEWDHTWYTILFILLCERLDPTELATRTWRESVVSETGTSHKGELDGISLSNPTAVMIIELVVFIEPCFGKEKVFFVCTLASVFPFSLLSQRKAIL